MRPKKPYPIDLVYDMGVNFGQALLLGLNPYFPRQGVIHAGLIGRRIVSRVGLEGKPQVAVGRAVVGVEKGIGHGADQPLQTLFFGVVVLLHPGFSAGLRRRLFRRSVSFSEPLDRVAYPGAEAPVDGPGDGLHFLLDGGLVASAFVYAVLPQADMAAFLQLVVNHVLHQVVGDLGGVLRPERDAGQSSSSPARAESISSCTLLHSTHARRDTSRRHCDAAMEALEKSLIAREEEGGFEVEEQNGVLNILFDDPPGKFASLPIPRRARSGSPRFLPASSWIGRRRLRASSFPRLAKCWRWWIG